MAKTTDQAPPPKTDTYPPLQGVPLIIATIFVAMATFMCVLDTSIANVAIPNISGNLGVSSDEGTWVITIFAAANAISIPLTGWFTQRLGQVKLFVGAILAFVVASWLCGVAPTLPFLLAARILQGVAAGPLIPLSQAILLGSWPKEKASTALTLWGTTATVGPIAGPLLGGWITDSYNWSWIFYVNIPVGIAAAAVIWMIYRHRETPTRQLPIDIVGLGLLITWVASLQVLLDKGKDLDWFGSPFIDGLGITALISFAFFLVWELTEKHPIVDLRLFMGRNFRWCTIAIAVSYALYFGNLVLLPQWMQADLGYTAFDAGLMTAPVGIFTLLLAPVSGRFLPRFDTRLVATCGFLGFAGVFFMRSDYIDQVDPYHLILPTLLQGIPAVLWFIPLTRLILSGLPPERIPAAAGLSNFARIFCGAAGTSVATTIWNNRTILHHERLTEQANVYNPTFNAQIAAMQNSLHVDLATAHGMFDSILTSQAAVMGLDDFFYISSAIFILMIPLVWLTRPVRGMAAQSVPESH